MVRSVGHHCFGRFQIGHDGSRGVTMTCFERIKTKLRAIVGGYDARVYLFEFAIPNVNSELTFLMTTSFFVNVQTRFYEKKRVKDFCPP